MIRRLNYTGRQRIRREDVRFVVMERKDASPVFRARIELGAYDFPGDARVYVEVYRQTSWMRFAFGTVGKLVPPERTELADFDSPEGVLFRVRVTSSDGAEAKLLAEADHIRSSTSEEVEEPRDWLLPVQPHDLGAQVWRLDLSDAPRLLINRELWDWKAVGRSPAFVSLVYPAVLREVLYAIAVDEEYLDTEDTDDWRSRWLRFATLIPGVPPVPDVGSEPEKRKEWIEEAVSAFCRRQGTLDRFVKFWRSEGIR